LGHDQDQVGHVPVEHERLAAVEQVPVAVAAGPGRHAVGRPRAVVLGPGQGGDRRAFGHAGQELLGGGLVAAEQQRVRGEHRGGEERRAQQRAAHLLARERQFDRPRAGPAVLLRDDQALQAKLPGELRPGLRVVALLGRHEPAHLGRGRLVLQEAAQAGR
jgi:hypothetical protein